MRKLDSILDINIVENAFWGVFGVFLFKTQKKCIKKIAGLK